MPWIARHPASLSRLRFFFYTKANTKGRGKKVNWKSYVALSTWNSPIKLNRRYYWSMNKCHICRGYWLEEGNLQCYFGLFPSWCPHTSWIPHFGPINITVILRQDVSVFCSVQMLAVGSRAYSRSPRACSFNDWCNYFLCYQLCWVENENINMSFSFIVTHDFVVWSALGYWLLHMYIDEQ